jgi:hypothetical protein
LPLVVPVLLCGCTHGFDRDALRERLNDGMLPPPDATAAGPGEPKPKLQFPCRIAVYLKPSGDRDWHWTPAEEALVGVWADAIKKSGVVADVFPLPDVPAGKGEINELRLAAAQSGADTLLVVRGVSETLRHANPLSALNLTVIGGFVLPGSSRYSLFLLDGVLMDVNTGHVYAEIRSEGKGQVVRPTFLIKNEDAVVMAKTGAIKQFSSEMPNRVRALATRREPARAGGRIVIEGTEVTPPDGKPRLGPNLDLRSGKPPDAGGATADTPAPRPNP